MYLCSIIFALNILLGSLNLFGKTTISEGKKWVGTWATSPQLVEPDNMPPSPGLKKNSLRQVVRVSIGGDTLRLKLSNEFSESPVKIKLVKFSLSAGADAIHDSTTKKLTFNGGNYEFTMDSAGAITSDPFAFDLQPRMDVAITIYFDTTSATVSGHPGSRTTSYLLAGNDTSVINFASAVKTDHWYVINGIDVLAPSTASSIAVIGNSITDGRGTTTNLQNRWTDILSERLLAKTGTEQVGVLNHGLGGNCVLKYCKGPAAIDRFERDVLNQSGVRAAIVFEGINDIGGVTTINAVNSVTNDLIAAYKQMIDSAHARGILIYGATIMPCYGHSYYSKNGEICRNKVNEWIRNSGRFDAVIDFDKMFRDPANPAKLSIPTYGSDGLHPDAAGYKKMGDSIDLSLFVGIDTLLPKKDTSGIESLWIEPECTAVGENWKQIIDPTTSNQSYVTVEPGFSSISAAPTDSASTIYVPFTVTLDTTFYINALLKYAGTDSNAIWLKLDDEDFLLIDSISTSGWEWKKLSSYPLLPGEHTLAFAYYKDNISLDKLYITSDTNAPTGIGKAADIVCLPDTATPVSGISNLTGNSDAYFLGQNYPNPFSEKTTIAFEIKQNTYVSLKVFSILGEEIVELAGKDFTAGMHTVEFDAKGLSKGIYFYNIKTDKYSASRRMILQTE